MVSVGSPSHKVGARVDGVWLCCSTCVGCVRALASSGGPASRHSTARCLLVGIPSVLQPLVQKNNFTSPFSRALVRSL